jgi:hypothetical protein
VPATTVSSPNDYPAEDANDDQDENEDSDDKGENEDDEDADDEGENEGDWTTDSDCICSKSTELVAGTAGSLRGLERTDGPCLCWPPHIRRRHVS